MILERFLEYLQYERGRSSLTIKSYGEDLRLFESYFKGLDAGLSWELVDSDIVRDWMEEMMNKGNSAATINRRLSAVRSLFCFALSRNYVEHDPTRSVRSPKKDKNLPMFLKETEMDELLAPRMWDMTSYEDVCLRTILQTFYETGMRLSELIGLDDASVNMGESTLTVLGKGNKQRIIPFGKSLRDSFTDYLAVRDSQEVRNTTAFFQSPKGERMKAGWLRKRVISRLSTVCTLKKKSPHVLRHTFATAMLNHDAGIESVRRLLGHKTLSTTEIYTHTTFEQLKKAYANSHPRV